MDSHPAAGRPARVDRDLRSMIVIGALIASMSFWLAVAMLSSNRAHHHHEAVVAATDLRLAVLTAAPITDASTLTPRELGRLEQAADVLHDSHDRALSAIDPADRAEATEELAAMAQHSRMLLAGMVMDEHHHSLNAHAELEDLLRDAAIRGGDGAADQERTAGIAAAVSALTFVSLGGYLFALRSRQRDERSHTQAMGQAAERFSTLLDDSLEATAIITPDGHLSYKAGSLTELFPNTTLSTAESLVSLAPPSEQAALRDHLVQEGAERATWTFSSTPVAGSADLPREFVVRVSDLRDDPFVGGWLVAMREISAEVQATRALKTLAETDPLTGLPNRRALLLDLEQDHTTPFGFLMIDLDGFKRTNDSFGHDAGDELLVAVTRRFQRCLGPGDRLYRLAGDEFAAITPDTEGPALKALGARLVESLVDPVRLAAGFEHTSGSVGAAVWDFDGEPRAMLHRADTAMYAAKEIGGNAVQLLTPEIEARSMRQRDMRRALADASLDEFWLAYQPIVDANTGHIASVEALIRWASPILGAVGPDAFIALAEHSGKIVEIGLWVLESACADLARWRRSGVGEDLGVTINVSPFQLAEPGFISAVEQAVEDHGIRPQDLTIELTESVLVTSKGETLKRLDRLRAFGCHIACDDFGSGYSNLGQLMALPLDVIKIDRGLVTKLAEMSDADNDGGRRCEVSAAIVAIGDAMQATVVAEGVETVAQRDRLRRSGVPLLQGYLFSRPIPAEQFEALMWQQASQSALTG